MKKNARRRRALTEKLQRATGGGRLTDAERKIVESNLYGDLVAKMGISAIGSGARFDSDQEANSNIEPPTNRLRRVMSVDTRRESVASSDIMMSSASIFDDDLFVASTSAMSLVPRQSDSIVASTSAMSLIPRRSDSIEASTSSSNLPSTQRESIESTIPPSRRDSYPPLLRRRESTETRKRPAATATATSSAKRTKKDAKNDNATQLEENLKQQHENNKLQHVYLELQVQRAEVALRREELQTAIVEVELSKASELKAIEVEKQKMLAKMEVEAKRREYNLPHNFGAEDVQML